MSENALTKDFCSGCDMSCCCSRPVVLPEEMESIIKAKKMGFLQRRRIFEKHGDYYIISGKTCPFLKENACSIDQVKPLNCRIFPLALANNGKDAEWALSPECPSCDKIPHEFMEHAKDIGKPLLEKHRKEGAMI